jgi:hypothetical protein
MKLIIAGSRTFTDSPRLCQVLAPDHHRITRVLTGGARGAEQLGYRWAWKHTVRHQLFRADWERFRKGGEHDACKIPDSHDGSAKTRASVRLLHADCCSGFRTIFQGILIVLALARVP